MWCSSAVNLSRLSRLAVSRTRPSPVNALSWLGVQCVVGSDAFPLAVPLPSTASAGCPLFGGFFGTMATSDFSSAGITGVWFPFPVPPDIAPSGTDEISQLLCKQLPDMLRVSDRAGSQQDSRVAPCCVLPSVHNHGIGIPDLPISRLNGWPVGVPCQRFALHLAI